MIWSSKYALQLLCMLSACAYTVSKNLTQLDIDIMRRSKMYAITNFMDTNINPCDDFYKFACGKWNRINPAITIEHLTTGLFEEMKQLHERKVEKLLLTNDPDFKYTANDNKVKDFFVSCVNLEKQEDKYKQKLIDTIAEFGEMPAISGDKWNEKKFDWVATIAKIAHKYGKDIILSMDIMADIKNNSVNRVYIGQATLPLNSRKMYLDNSTSNYRVAYKDKIRENLIKFLGINAELATKTASEIIDFEVKLAHGIVDESQGLSFEELTNLTTVELMHAKYSPQIDIRKLVNITLGELITFPLYECVEPYQENLKQIIKTTPKYIVANYIFYTLISEYLLDIYKSPQKQKQICIAKINLYFAKNTDNMVYRKYNSEKTERDIDYMWSELKEGFRRKLLSGELNWITAPTLKYAQEKLDALKLEVNSYKNHNFTEDFAPLSINKDDYLANVLAIMELKTKQSLAKLHEPPTPHVAAEELSYSPANILTENIIKVPVSLLQPYLLWSDIYPAAIKFGTLGALIGHELIHAFDDTGRLYDKDGNANDWWDEASTAAFLNRTECFSVQYSQYQYGGQNLTKSVSQSENIADNGGMRLAYRSYLRWYENTVRANGVVNTEQLPDFPYDYKQLFFISFAQIWCNDAHPMMKVMKTVTDQHMPGELRVIGSISNYKEFAKAFECKEGSRMNPKDKCEIY